MVIRVFRSPSELIEVLATNIVQLARESIAARGEFNFVLSGGKSPEPLYEALTSMPPGKRPDWSKVNFFFGDERYVAASDPANNANMARKRLLGPLKIEESKIVAVDTSLSPEDAAQKYSARINEHFKNREPKFDLILLGLGDNSHTASLFPHTPVLLDRSASVKAVFLNEENKYRISMTAPLINMAHHVAFLVYGRTKAEAVQHVLEGKQDTDLYPAQLINPQSKNLDWYIDDAAASLLNKSNGNTYQEYR